MQCIVDCANAKKRLSKSRKKSNQIKSYHFWDEGRWAEWRWFGLFNLFSIFLMQSQGIFRCGIFSKSTIAAAAAVDGDNDKAKFIQIMKSLSKSENVRTPFGTCSSQRQPTKGVSGITEEENEAEVQQS